jgi:hypothetical protein
MACLKVRYLKFLKSRSVCTFMRMLFIYFGYEAGDLCAVPGQVTKFCIETKLPL